MGNRIKVCLAPDFDAELAPIPAIRYRNWWEDNRATQNHARHCLPLNMANSLGFYILSPGTFKVRWNGDVHSRAVIEHIDKSSHYEVDDHASFASFTVQAKFIPVTDDPGDFVYIKGIPNMRCTPYTCMEAIIEAWWSVANFGLVFMINQPGEFTIEKGHPIAQMFMYHGAAGAAIGELHHGYPDGHREWLARRSRPDYVKDYDYLKGNNFTGYSIESHVTNWKDATKFRK